MKQLSMLFLAGALLAGSSVKAQTVEEIVRKHNDAVGGLDNWKKVTSLKYVGTMNAQGTTIDVAVSMLDGKATRVDFTINGMANYFIITTMAGWVYMPIQGQTKPEPMTADRVKESADDLYVLDAISSAAARGSTVEFVGKDDVDGTECLKLKVTTKSGSVKTEFVDPATYHIIRETEKQKADGKETEVINNFANYTKLPEGIVVPLTQESTAMGTIKYTVAEVNTIKDESIFKPSKG